MTYLVIAIGVNAFLIIRFAVRDMADAYIDC